MFDIALMVVYISIFIFFEAVAYVLYNVSTKKLKRSAKHEIDGWHRRAMELQWRCYELEEQIKALKKKKGEGDETARTED